MNKFPVTGMLSTSQRNVSVLTMDAPYNRKSLNVKTIPHSGSVDGWAPLFELIST